MVNQATEALLFQSSCGLLHSARNGIRHVAGEATFRRTSTKVFGGRLETLTRLSHD
jgi:hypothetical protein